MRIARFSVGDLPLFGVLEEGSSRITALKGDPMFAPVEPSGQFFDLEQVRLLSPVIPRSKVVCIGRNYAEHAKEMGNEVPAAPIIFLKPNTSVIGPDDPIVLPKWSQEVHHEVELGVVIKSICKDVSASDSADFILGYLIGNDCSARDAQRSDGQWSRAKGWDTSCPLGPWISVNPDLDVQNLAIRCRVDGQIRQDGVTADMIHSVNEVISYISQAMTLLPGDVVLTGTPAGVGPIMAGQRVEVEIEGIGSFSNPVIRR